MLELIQTAQKAGLTAKYVLFDSWFSSPRAVVALKQEHGLETIAMVKKSSKIKYGYQDGRFNIKEIYSKNRKRRGHSKYLLSVNVTIGDEAIPAKIVCVRNKSKKKIGWQSSARILPCQKKSAVVSMEKVGTLRFFSNPVHPISV